MHTDASFLMIQNGMRLSLQFILEQTTGKISGNPSHEISSLADGRRSIVNLPKPTQ